MNELQRIQTNTEKAFSELYTRIMSDLSVIQPKTTKGVNKVFTDNGYIDISSNIIINANYNSSLVGLGTSYTIASLDDFSEYFLHTNFDGLTLSERLHNSQADAVTEVTSVIKKELKFRTNWKKLSNEISKKANTVGDVAGVIDRLGAEGNNYLNGKMSLKEMRKFRAKIKKAKAYVSNLSEGNAPTKQLKKAYADIINTVEGKGNLLLDTAIKNAFNKKIAYNNDRISRTELSRAHGQSFHRRINDDEDVAGWLWKLSPDHPKADICNYYADLDNGEGAGVYHKEDSVSIPAHTNCLCMQQSYVMKNNRSNNIKKMSKKEAIRYLDGLSENERGNIIGVNNAMYKSRYIKGLEKKGVVFGGSKPKALPKRLVKEKG